MLKKITTALFMAILIITICLGINTNKAYAATTAEIVSPEDGTVYNIGDTIEIGAIGNLLQYQTIYGTINIKFNLIYFKITLNGEKIEYTWVSYNSVSEVKTISFVAEQPGEYLIEVCRSTPTYVAQDDGYLHLIPIEYEDFYPQDSIKVIVGGLDQAEITGIKNKTYTGEPITQDISITLAGNTLTENTDYTLEYNNNVNAGTAEVKIVGDGGFTGQSVTKTFTIAPAAVKNAKVSGLSDMVYTGNALKPEPVVKVGSRTLVKDTDYTLSYKNNKEVGTATITVKGKGNYKDSISKEFKIVKSDLPFTDVLPSDGYYQAIKWAYENGLVKGITATLFGPKEEINRGAVATILYRYAGTPEIDKNKPNPFTDVKSTDGYYKPIMWAYQNGIVNGTSKTTFSPKDTCKRGQMATLLYKMAGKPDFSVPANPFTDVKSTDGYFKPIMWMYTKGITKGTSATTFGPKDPCTRAQFVTFLYKYDKVK